MVLRIPISPTAAATRASALDAVRARPAEALRWAVADSATLAATGLLVLINHPAFVIRMKRRVLAGNVVVGSCHRTARPLELAGGRRMSVLATGDYAGRTTTASGASHAENCQTENGP